jgi:hypothetical protein
MWYFVIQAIWRGWGPYIRSKRQKKTRVNAKVKNKLGIQEFNPITWQSEIMQKVLVFECEDGVDREYEVGDEVWDWVEIGDDGVLVYQGDLFVDFEAWRPRYDPDKVFRKLTRM